jgi:hypothetical protein
MIQIHLPPEIVVFLLTAAFIMIFLGLGGKVSIKEFEFGTRNSYMRVLLGFFGVILTVFALSSYISPTCDREELLIHRPDPTIAVRDHYEGIRGGGYYKAWERLPQQIKNDPKIHPDGYESFKSWFVSTNPIKVTNLVITGCQDYSRATVKVTYFSESKSKQWSLIYELQWNSQKNYWEFVNITPI